MILKQKIALLFHLEDALQEITGMLIEMARKLMEEDINIMTSIKVSGTKLPPTFSLRWVAISISLNVPGKSLLWRDWIRLFISPVNMKAKAE